MNSSGRGFVNSFFSSIKLNHEYKYSGIREKLTAITIYSSPESMLTASDVMFLDFEM